MTLNDVMAVILRYFTEFGKHNRVDLWRNLCTSLLYFVCRRKESLRSLSHLLMSFLFPFQTWLRVQSFHDPLLQAGRRHALHFRHVTTALVGRHHVIIVVMHCGRIA